MGSCPRNQPNPLDGACTGQYPACAHNMATGDHATRSAAVLHACLQADLCAPQVPHTPWDACGAWRSDIETASLSCLLRERLASSTSTSACLVTRMVSMRAMGMLPTLSKATCGSHEMFAVFLSMTCPIFPEPAHSMPSQRLLKHALCTVIHTIFCMLYSRV